MGAQTGTTDYGKVKDETTSSGKMKRSLFEMKLNCNQKSVDGMSSAIRVGTLRIYNAVIDVPDFSKEAQLFCLNYLMLNKGIVRLSWRWMKWTRTFG